MFNNVFYDPSDNVNGGHAIYVRRGTSFSSTPTTGTYFYNNTFVHVSGFFFSYGGVDHINVTFCQQYRHASLGAPGLPITQAGFYTNQGGPLFADEIVGWNRNVYWPATGGSPTCGASAGANGCVWLWDSATPYSTFSAWKTFCGCDANSVQSDPNLTGSYQLNAGSPAIQSATNLSSMCTMNGGTWPDALCYDKPLTVGVGGNLFWGFCGQPP